MGNKRRGPNAAIVYTTFIDTLLANHEALEDHNGKVLGQMSGATDGLGRCLPHLPEGNLRQKVYQTLTQLYIENVKMGGYGYSDGVDDVVARHAPGKEKEAMAHIIEDELTKTESMDEGKATEWKIKDYGRLLLFLREATLTNEQFLTICRRSGLFKQLVERLLTLDQVEEARQVSTQATDYDLTILANLFVDYGHGDVAETIVGERAARSNENRLMRWLMDYALRTETWSKAIDHAEHLFAEAPSLKLYQEIWTIGERLGDWESRRLALHADLERDSRRWDVLLKIYLLENKVTRALSLLAHMERKFNHYKLMKMRLDVAQAAIVDHPREAIRLYKSSAQVLIDERGRENYQAAAQITLRIKEAYDRLGEGDAWKAYITVSKKENKRLRALLDEFKQVGV